MSPLTLILCLAALTGFLAFCTIIVCREQGAQDAPPIVLHITIMEGDGQEEDAAPAPTDVMLQAAAWGVVGGIPQGVN